MFLAISVCSSGKLIFVKDKILKLHNDLRNRQSLHDSD
jgi:hypothetical protein